MSTRIKIYFAGPLFTLAEREFNRRLKNKLTQLGYDVFLPQESEASKRSAEDPVGLAHDDKDQVRRCDVLVAILDGADSDSGTSLEVGMAIILEKRTLGVRTDFRMSEEKQRVNLMFLLMDTIIYYDGQSIDGLANKIHEAILSGHH